MTRRLMIIGVLTALAASTAAAHENYRIIGTLTKVSATEIAVKQTKDGKTIGMDIDKTAKVSRDKKPVGVAELRPGLSVVVDARGDSLEELLVREVRIVSAPAPAKK